MNPLNPDLEAKQAGQDDPQEAELNKAIEELRGVLHEDDMAAGSSAMENALGRLAGTGTTGASRAESFRGGSEDGQPRNVGVIMNIPVDVQIVLGTAEMSVSDLMALQKGSTVALDRRIGEPVDVVVNGRKIACGEITVLESDPSRFGIKLTQIIDAAKSG